MPATWAQQVTAEPLGSLQAVGTAEPGEGLSDGGQDRAADDVQVLARDNGTMVSRMAVFMRSSIVVNLGVRKKDC